MNECCVEENLVVAEKRQNDFVLKICKVCHKRHFELSLDKAEIFGMSNG